MLRWCGLLAMALAATPALAQTTATRNGHDIYRSFRDGLADKTCDAGSSDRWRQHYANAPRQMATKNDDVLPLFGYVVDALREADLPTEYALIPFVESGYKPGARSASGPAGLWQMIAVTARNHDIAIRPGYDGRLSPVDSTRAAVRYLKTLHGMFAGDWRLAVMAYNAGEYRVFGALKRSGQRANNAQPEQLIGLSGITQAYVRKLRALSCLFDQADEREDWMRALDRPVPMLAALDLPANAGSLDAWAARNGQDAALLKRLNPVYVGGRIAAGGKLRVLATSTAAVGAVTLPESVAANVESIAALPDSSPASIAAAKSTHTVVRGDSIWSIARRYDLSYSQLLDWNGLSAYSVLQPGMVLKLDEAPPAVDP